MIENIRSRVRRGVPGIGWRDELLAERAVQLQELREQLRATDKKVIGLRAKLRKQQIRERRPALPESSAITGDDTRKPSFLRQIRDIRRGVVDLNELDPGYSHPLAQIPRKLRNYRLAASHGVSPPEVFAVWESLDEVRLSDLPLDFVLKSDRGAGGRGVLPLRRHDADLYHVIGSDQRLTHQDVIDHFDKGAPSVGAPFFAEEFLNQPDGNALPDDIKLYMFYGRVGHVMLRRIVSVGGRPRLYFRFLDGAGADLGPDIAPRRRIDSSIDAPRDLAKLVDMASHLSRAVALPFIRVDMYETTSGPVFGELTCGPGGSQSFRPDHDAHLGWLWENGQYRLDLDVVAGRPLRNLLGEHPVNQHYRAAAGSQAPHIEEHGTVPCRLWCQR